MVDKFETYTESLSSPPRHLRSVTPDDANDLPVAGRCINVQVGGTIQVTTVAGDTGTIMVAAGITFPIRAQRIWATGTTATGISVLY